MSPLLRRLSSAYPMSPGHRISERRALTRPPGTGRSLGGDNPGPQNPSETRCSYRWFDGAKADITTPYQDVHNRSSGDYEETTNFYDGASHLIRADIADGQSRDVGYTIDLNGQVLARGVGTSANKALHEYWYHYGGREMGYTGTPSSRTVLYRVHRLEDGIVTEISQFIARAD